MRVPQYAAIGAAAAVLAALALAACSPADRRDPVACVADPAAITTQPAQAGAIRVAESGFTQLGRNDMVASIGAVLENTGDQVAYRTRIEVDVTGADGRSVVPTLSGETLIQEIPVILPKQKIPLGAFTYVEGRVTAVGVRLGPTTWLPPQTSLVQVTTEFQALSRIGSDRQTASVTYQMTSRYCRELVMRGTAIVFRNAGGEIVGGSFEVGAPRCPPGVSTQRPMASSSAPINIDETKTEVYPYCDLTAAVTPRPSNGPWN